ncbi:tyrosine-type recombinase/integrase [Pseudovibrio sp. Ad37]|uniref:tyrosine-type recombinase/integrase n=1 Tax=Pseudovibrio sp. Ad37 TaxID=989422 RepID=UPI00187D4034|nr:tyrosine-type recombinase/integrase [Pseudovibrio sp. Ad37]
MRTVRTALAALRGVAREAWLANLIPENEYRKIKEALPRISGHKIAKGRALSKDELSAMFNACRQRQSIRGLRDEAIISVLSLCGLRREELVKLNYEHVDWKASALIFTGKGNKERVSFMSKSVMTRIHEWCERVRGSHDGPLFFGITRGEITTEDRLTVQGLHYIVTKLAREAEIERCTAHDLRRTYATLQFENDVDILTVRDNMGHASVTTTQIYDHRDMEARRESTSFMEL